MEIVVYDTEHFETAQALVRLLDTGAHRIFLLVPQTLRSQLEAGGIHAGQQVIWLDLPPEKTKHASAVYRACKAHKAGLLILGTVAYRHYRMARACKKLRHIPIILGVHDIHDLFGKSTVSGWRNKLRALGKRWLRGAVSAYAVLLPEMKKLLLDTYQVTKPVYVVPGSVYDPIEPAIEKKITLRVVIPGSIDATRRNYTELQNLLGLLRSDNFQPELIVVGATPSGQALPAWMKEPPLKLITGEFVDVPEYESWLEAADLLWAPLPSVFRREGQADEFYGTSKSSGVFFDAIRHGKPLILPDEIQAPAFLYSSTIRYQDPQHLFYLLFALHDNPIAHSRLQEQAQQNASHFSVTNIRRQLAAAGFPAST
jgi:hypothetical protein